ncbi:MAG: hypothetical protein BWZ10_02814 [candidate division BRC1 bacterium ADurb.BinA364]|nr:MAG: hypothetical protein BWZ10_02814 [candidate division BRC1 bacterium ADurb.BinA364]
MEFAGPLSQRGKILRQLPRHVPGVLPLPGVIRPPHAPIVLWTALASRTIAPFSRLRQGEHPIALRLVPAQDKGHFAFFAGLQPNTNSQRSARDGARPRAIERLGPRLRRQFATFDLAPKNRARVVMAAAEPSRLQNRAFVRSGQREGGKGGALFGYAPIGENQAFTRAGFFCRDFASDHASRRPQHVLKVKGDKRIEPRSAAILQPIGQHAGGHRGNPVVQRDKRAPCFQR